MRQSWKQSKQQFLGGITVLFFGAIYGNLGAAETESLRLLATHNIHYFIEPIYYQDPDPAQGWFPQSQGKSAGVLRNLKEKTGGMAYLSTLIQRLRAEKPQNTLVIEGGNAWHGSRFSVLDEGAVMVKILNTIGYDVVTPGNWDFFYPKERFFQLIEQSEQPVIAYNVKDKEWDDPVLPQYTIKMVGRLKLGLIGMSYPWVSLTSSYNGVAQWFKFGIREEEAEELIEEIREDHDPDLIIFVSHAGYEFDLKFAKRVAGIDVIVSEHSAEAVAHPISNEGTLVFQSGTHAQTLAHLDLAVKDKKIVDFQYQQIPIRSEKIPADPQIVQLIAEAHRPHHAKMEEVIGETKVMLHQQGYRQSPTGNLMADALRETMQTDIALFPGWRYGETLMPGKIKVKDVYNLMPTEGQIITYSVAGHAIESILEGFLAGLVDPDPYSRGLGDMIRLSGLKVRVDLDHESGKRVRSILVNGEPLSHEKRYTVASIHTRFHTNPQFIVKDFKDSGKVFVEELVQYIRKHSPITTLDDRVILE